MNIYVVEDDENIRELVQYTLRASGYDTQGFGDAGAFRRGMGRGRPDLVVLDIMLPGEDGIALLSELRAGPDTRDLPVILLTARSAEYDKVLGLDAGADDYVTKPFGVMELVSRVRAVLRRSARNGGDEEAGGELCCGPLRMDPGRHQVLVDGAEIALTVKEFQVLRLLLQNPGRVFDRDALLDRVWGYAFDGETRTVDVHIRSLRKKLGTAGDLIETVRGIGYRIG